MFIHKSLQKWLIKLIAQEESDDDSDGEEESDDDDDDDDDSSEEESPAKAPVLNGKAKKVNPSIVSIVHSSKWSLAEQFIN